MFLEFTLIDNKFKKNSNLPDYIAFPYPIIDGVRHKVGIWIHDFVGPEKHQPKHFLKIEPKEAINYENRMVKSVNDINIKYDELFLDDLDDEV